MNDADRLLSENDNIKLCSICGSRTKLTFEHFPPEASGNNKKVNMYGLENLVDLGGRLFGKFSKSPRGMGGYKLCKPCNTITGAWYGPSYIEFANQLKSFINDNLGKDGVRFKFTIKPLNFLKQVMSIMLSADQATGILRKEIQKTNFILDREQTKLSDRIHVSMGISLQPTYGFKGFTPEWTDVNGHTFNSEFVFRPFAFLVSLDKEKFHHQFDLREFLKYNYDQIYEIDLKLDLAKFEKI